MPIFESEYPVPVTGSVFVINQTSGSGGGGGGDVNITASITLPVSMTNPVTNVTASVNNFPTGFNVQITGSSTLPITASLQNPVGITGSVYVLNSQGSDVNITGTITLPVNVQNGITASIVNLPVTQTIDGTVTVANPVTDVTATIVNLPATQSIDGTVTVGNPVLTSSVNNFPAKYDTVPLVPNPTQYYPVRLTDGTNYYNSSGGGSGSGGTTIVVVPPKQVALTGALSRVPQTASAVTLLGGNPSTRLGFTIFNSSSVGLGVSYTDATAVSGALKIGPYSVYESDETVFAGTIYGIWDAAGSGAAWVTEYQGQQAVSGTLSVTQGPAELATQFKPWYVRPAPYAQSSFGEARVANPYTLGDIINKYGIDEYEWAQTSSIAGGIAAVPARAAIRLTTAATSGGFAKIRTNTYYRYQSGRGQRILQTCVHDAATTDQVRRWGYFDDNDGLFWQASGSTFGFVRRTSTSGVPVDNFIPQSAFNIDKFDGTGVSQQNLDLTKGNIYEMDFQWLGVGNVNLFINGLPVHQISNPNTLNVVYMKTAVLPISVEVVNNDVVTSGTGFEYICTNVTSEGGQAPPQYGNAAGRTALKTAITNAAQPLPVFAVRLSATFNEQANRAIVLPKHLSLYAESVGVTRCNFFVVVNPATITGAVWTAVDTTSSVAEFDQTATAYTGGQVIWNGFFNAPVAGNNYEVDLSELFAENARKLRRNSFTGVSDVVLIGCRSTTATNISVDANMNWTEIK